MYYRFALVIIILAGPNVEGQAPNVEPVSRRLKRELLHPNKTAWMAGLRFSPDGKQVIAGEPGGILQVWDAETGKQLTKIQLSGEQWTSTEFFVSPDWKTVYAAREHTDNVRGILPSDVTAWDLASGRLSDTFTFPPPGHHIRRMVLSPDGSTFVSFSFSFAGNPAKDTRQTSLWDVKSKEFRALPGVFPPPSAPIPPEEYYSPSGTLLAVPVQTDNNCPNVIRVFDTATAKLKLSIPAIAKDNHFIHCLGFSPDSLFLVSFDAMVIDAKKAQVLSLKLWDTATGKELDSFQLPNMDIVFRAHFHLSLSPPIRRLAVSTVNQQLQCKLLMFDVSDNKFVKSFVFDNDFMPDPVFSPCGKWIAVQSWKLPADFHKREYKTEELPQLRIHLLDTTSGKIRETLAMPPGNTGLVSFSPDGQTLAARTDGRVLLFDLSVPPGKK